MDHAAAHNENMARMKAAYGAGKTSAGGASGSGGSGGGASGSGQGAAKKARTK